MTYEDIELLESCIKEGEMLVNNLKHLRDRVEDDEGIEIKRLLSMMISHIENGTFTGKALVERWTNV